MFKFNEGFAGAFGTKADFDFAGFVHVRIEFPVGRVVAGTKMPGEADSVRRVPLENGAPVALSTLDIALVPAAADARLDEDGFEGCFANVMRGGPPGFHLFDEDREGV